MWKKLIGSHANYRELRWWLTYTGHSIHLGKSWVFMGGIIHPKGSTYSVYTDKHTSGSQLSFTICPWWSSPTPHFPSDCFIFLLFFSVHFFPFSTRPNTRFLSVLNCGMISKIASSGPSLGILTLVWTFFVSFCCAAIMPGSRLPYGALFHWNSTEGEYELYQLSPHLLE